eukprot:13224641-Ditylum_brightwellii.AAC.1
MTALRELYQITVDWDGKLFGGISLQWDYVNRTVDLSMPGYIEQALLKFQHSAPHQPEHSPHNAAEPLYTCGPQYAPLPNNSLHLDQHHKRRIQQILGILLFYAQAVDPMMLASINIIAAQQAAPTKKTAAAIVKLLNYAAMNPDAVV